METMVMKTVKVTFVNREASMKEAMPDLQEAYVKASKFWYKQYGITTSTPVYVEEDDSATVMYTIPKRIVDDFRISGCMRSITRHFLDHCDNRYANVYTPGDAMFKIKVMDVAYDPEPETETEIKPETTAAVPTNPQIFTDSASMDRFLKTTEELRTIVDCLVDNENGWAVTRTDLAASGWHVSFNHSDGRRMTIAISY